MALSTQAVLRDNYVLRSILGKVGPFDITYLGSSISDDDKKVVIREYFPTFLAGRSTDGLSLVALSPREKTLFEFGRDLYLRHAQEVGKTNHLSILPQLDYFIENNTVYTVGPFLSGIMLSDVLTRQKGQIHERGALSIMIPLLNGLHHAHQAGIIHSNISPGSIFLTKAGQPMMLHLMKAKIELAQLCNKTNLIDQSGFTAPEILVNRGKTGPWTDVYGCASTLYSILTGKRLQNAFDRLMVDNTAEDITTSEVLSAGLKELFIHALAIDPGHRPQTISAFQTLLAACIPDNTGNDRKSSPAKQFVKKAIPDKPGHTLHDRASTAHYPEVKAAPLATEINAEINAKINNVPPVKNLPGKNDLPPNGSYEASAISPTSVDKKIATPSIEGHLKRESQTIKPLKRKRSINATQLFIMVLFVIIGGAVYAIKTMFLSPVKPFEAMRVPEGHAATTTTGDHAFIPAWEQIQSIGDSLREQAQLFSDKGDSTTSQELWIATRQAYLDAINMGSDDTTLYAYVTQIDDIVEAYNKPAPDPNLTSARQTLDQLELAIHRADSLFETGALAPAQEAFRRVLTIDSNHAHATMMLRQIVNQIDEVGKEKTFQQYVRRAQSLFESKRYAEAQNVYRQARSIKVTESVVQQLILIDQLLTETEQKEAEFSLNLSNGNEQMSNGDYKAALTSYLAAEKVAPGENNMFSLISTATDSIKALTIRNEVLEEKYRLFTLRGDSLLNRKNFEGAISSYSDALNVIPGDTNILDKLEQVQEAQTAFLNSLTDENGVFLRPDKPPQLIGEAQLLSKVRYPRAAREKGVKGRVVLRMIVDKSGKVEEALVVRGIGYGCDEEALRLFRTARFEPALFRNQPVPSWFSFSFVFSLYE